MAIRLNKLYISYQIQIYNKESPLTLLAARKCYDMSLLKLLVSQNANREHENEDFMRPVDLARQSNGKADIMKLLRSK